MISEKKGAKKTLAVALIFALFAGSPLDVLAQTRAAAVTNVPAGLGVVGSVGTIGTAVPGLALPTAILAPSLAPSLVATPVLAPAAVTPALVPALAAPAAAKSAITAQPAEVAAALAAAKSLPVGSLRDTVYSFVGAMSDAERAGANTARIFDSSRKLNDSDDEAVDGSSEEMGGDVPAAAQALHKAWEQASKQRVVAFEEAVKQVKVGRVGIKIAYQLSEEGQLSYGVAYTIDDKPMKNSELPAALAAAGVTPAAWTAAKAELDGAVPELVKQLVSTLQQNEREHQLVHKKMDAFAKLAAMKSVKETLQKGTDLQTWGIPVSISINQKTGMRYARTYRLNGMPTDFGSALHDLIAPLVAADPKFLAKITNVQLHEAAQYVNDSLRYSLDMETPDGMKRMRLSGARGMGYDYPEPRKALLDLARRKLTEKPLPNDRYAGLGSVPKNLQPASAMMEIFKDLMEKFQEKAQAGASAEELATMQSLLVAMHSAIGIPVRTPDGMTMLPIAHRQLVPILAELARRNSPAEVVRAVIRTFPLGESLLRLGVADLWAQGVTGKGIKVAVIDNGVDFDHPDFADIQNPVSENMTRDRGPHTKGGHGTPMASIIHAIAPDAEIQNYQALPNTDGLVGVALSQEETVQAVLKAMDRAKANGANIISMSLGFPMAYANDPVAMKVAELKAAGIVVIVSAGNEGGELPKGMQIRSPASSPDAIAIGAVDYHGKIASFSSEGWVYNPSDGTAAEKPDFYAPGVNIKAAMQLPQPMYGQEPVPYNPVSGTSPAAPHVTGVVALMMAAARAAGGDVTTPGMTDAVREGLMAGVKRVGRLPVVSDAVKAVKAFVDRVAKPLV
ncbi:MAG: S8 family serine peptidase [Elusimicrobia bacterium]|nr:S8 family serine peptidase [Elusimicrobiota bacterium]